MVNSDARYLLAWCLRAAEIHYCCHCSKARGLALGQWQLFLFILEVDDYILHKYIYSNFILHAIRLCGALAVESIVCCPCPKVRGLALGKSSFYFFLFTS
jgi:sulfur relay (sulfurtransferase) complex TusBCD TusD component (DsrE family)